MAYQEIYRLVISDDDVAISVVLLLPINEIANTTGRKSMRKASDATGNQSGNPAVSVRLLTASKAPQPATR